MYYTKYVNPKPFLAENELIQSYLKIGRELWSDN